MNMCVAARINGYDTRAVISTGAGATIVSESFARETKLLVLVDKRFAGTARGVGRAKIIGRVHSAQIQLGTDEGVMMPTAITVLESSAWPEEEILLGLDFLKRYRCTVDFRRNKLILPLSKTTVPMFEDSVKRIGRKGGWILA
jgi:DNA damage-inducible protein 1